MTELLRIRMGADGTEEWITPVERPEITLSKPPEPVGYWVMYPGAVCCTKWPMFARPTDEQIENTKRLLGWGWEEVNHG